VALLTAAAGLHCAPASAATGLRLQHCSHAALTGRDPLLAHATSAACTRLALKAAGLARSGSALSSVSARPSSARSRSLSFACEPAESSEPLAQLVRRLQSRARGPCALEDCRRMRALLDSGDELMALGVDSPPEAIDSAAERRAHLSGLVLAASDLAFLALPRAMHLRWAELCTDLEAPDAAGWLRGEVELLAVPIYETLRAVGAAARQVPTSNSNSARPNVLSTPLRHLRDNARHWKETPLAPSSAAFQKKSQACREGVFTEPSRTVTHVSTMPPRLDAAQVTMIPDKFRGAHTKMDPAHVSPSRLREAACDPIVLPAALPICGRSLPCSFRFK
ncbi:unnamed protein product, partial [Polarella glacialis]